MAPPGYYVVLSNSFHLLHLVPVRHCDEHLLHAFQLCLHEPSSPRVLELPATLFPHWELVPVLALLLYQSFYPLSNRCRLRVNTQKRRIGRPPLISNDL